jgi:hypothetical protein
MTRVIRSMTIVIHTVIRRICTDIPRWGMMRAGRLPEKTLAAGRRRQP